jgi:hypothetical protein
MPLSITTKEFQETASQLQELAERDPDILNNKELQDRFIEEKGLNVSDFDKAYVEYLGEVNLRKVVLIFVLKIQVSLVVFLDVLLVK